jgi:TfoX/Sxy family transcriptional regulator of competence genes
MHWEKPSKGLVETFDSAIAGLPLAERRLMFGMPAAFLNGNMFAGLHGERMVLRLPDAPRAELIGKEGGGIFAPMPGRPMKDYALVPPAILADSRQLDEWLAKAFEHAQTLPVKEKKARKTKAKK